MQTILGPPTVGGLTGVKKPHHEMEEPTGIVKSVTGLCRCKGKHGRRVDHGGTRRTSPPEYGVGDASANCPPQMFVIQIQKGAFCGLQISSKYAKIRFRPGLCPDEPRWGSSRRSPRPLVGWRGGTPHHIPPHSAPTHLRRAPCVPSEFQPDLRL